MIGLGIYLYQSDINVLAGDIFARGILMLGVFVFLVGMIGFASAWKEIVIGLIIFAAALGLIICAEVFVVIYFVSSPATAQDWLIERWTETLTTDDQARVQDSFDC